MIIIKRFPKAFKDYFRQFSKLFCKKTDYYNHFWRFILVIASLEGQFSLSKMETLTDHRRSRQAVVYFLEKAEWDERKHLAKAALTMLKRLGWRTNDPLYLVLDDTQIEKRGSKMEGVSSLYLHSEKRYAKGHEVISLSIVYQGVIIPYALRVWVSEEECAKIENGDHKFRNKMELAADCIKSFDIKSRKVTVIFDRFYLCQKIVSECKAKGFYFIGAVKKNRKMKSSLCSSRFDRVGVYSQGFLQRTGRNFKIPGSNRKHRIAERTCYLSKVGDVKVVFSKRLGDQQIVSLATNDLNIGAKDVVEIYRNRWSIEVMFKSVKQQLGIGDYHFLKLRAVERYLHIVMISYVFLTHLAYKKLNEKESKNANNPIRLAGITETKMELRKILINDVFERINPQKYDLDFDCDFKILIRNILELFVENKSLKNARKNISC